MKRTTLFATLAVVAAVACGPAEDRQDRWTDDDPEARVPTPEMQAQMNQLRSEVDSVLNEMRTEIDQMRDRATGEEPVQRWTRVSTRYEETRGEIMSDLEEARTADDRDELRRVRDRTSERLAELEADVVRAELETSTDAQTLTQRVEQQLSSLESDLAEIRARIGQSPHADVDRPRTGEQPGEVQPRDRPAEERPMAQDRPRDRDDRGVTDRAEGWFTDDIDEREIENLRDELMELREEAARIPERARDDDFEGVRDDLSGSVADLTQDVRKHYYALRWTGPEHAAWNGDWDRDDRTQDPQTQQY